MKIGLSLPYSFLSNHLSDSDTVLLSSLGPPKNAFVELASKIEYIELGNFSTDDPPELISAAVKNVWKSGLKISLHPSLPVNVSGKTLAEIYPWLMDILPEVSHHQNELILNVHALSSSHGSESQLKSRTIKNLTHITGLITKNNYPLKIALELNRSKGKVDPCTTFRGVLDICEQVDSPVLGIGWDLGHTYANYQNRLLPLEPPKEFLKKIVHTHIHDLSSEGKTHWPLIMKVVPLNTYLEFLREVDYRGIYMLELQPEFFAGWGDVKTLIYDSIERLGEALERLGG